MGAAFRDRSQRDQRLSEANDAINAGPRAAAALFLARRFEHVPRGIRQIEEVVEFPGAAQPQAAVNHHAFTIHVVGLFTQQIYGKIGEFIVASEAAHGVMFLGALFQFLGRQQARPRTLGGKRSRRDGVQPDVMARPFDRERARQRQHTGFRAGRRHHKSGAAIRGSISRHNVQHVSGLLRGDPFFPQRQRAEKGALQHDSHHGIKGVRRKFFRARDKISGGVIHQRVHAPKFLFGRLHGFFHGAEIAYVRGGVSRAGAFGANRFGGFLQRLFAPRHQKNIRAQLGATQRHRTSQPRAAARNENGAALQQIALIHGKPPSRQHLYSSRIAPAAASAFLRQAKLVATGALLCYSVFSISSASVSTTPGAKERNHNERSAGRTDSGNTDRSDRAVLLCGDRNDQYSQNQSYQQ